MWENFRADRRRAKGPACSVPTRSVTSSANAPTAKITDDRDELVAFFDYPAEHWIRLRTTTPIESTFTTVPRGTKSPRAPAEVLPGPLRWHSSYRYKLLSAESRPSVPWVPISPDISSTYRNSSS
jgi:hypothetical protein